jgi:hypothetical protein
MQESVPVVSDRDGAMLSSISSKHPSPQRGDKAFKQELSGPVLGAEKDGLHFYLTPARQPRY